MKLVLLLIILEYRIFQWKHALFLFARKLSTLRDFLFTSSSSLSHTQIHTETDSLTLNLTCLATQHSPHRTCLLHFWSFSFVKKNPRLVVWEHWIFISHSYQASFPTSDFQGLLVLAIGGAQEILETQELLLQTLIPLSTQTLEEVGQLLHQLLGPSWGHSRTWVFTGTLWLRGHLAVPMELQPSRVSVSFQDGVWNSVSNMEQGNPLQVNYRVPLGVESLRPGETLTQKS